MDEEQKGLWKDPDFLRLWAGETVSLFGSHITYLALPLMAALVLDATPAQMGYLGAARYVPFVLVTLFAGVWVDRHRRRPILIVSNIGRALLMGAIPLLAFRGTLSMEHLYGIGFLVGTLTVFFDLAYGSYLPMRP
jgi:MFS family permease